MTQEGKVEAFAVAGIAAVVLFLWLGNRQAAPVATVLPVGDSYGYTPVTPQDSAGLSAVQPIPPSVFNYLPGGSGAGIAPNGACGCSTCANGGGFGLTFGSARDLNAYLASMGNGIPPGADIGGYF